MSRPLNHLQLVTTPGHSGAIRWPLIELISLYQPFDRTAVSWLTWKQSEREKERKREIETVITEWEIAQMFLMAHFAPPLYLLYILFCYRRASLYHRLSLLEDIPNDYSLIQHESLVGQLNVRESTFPLLITCLDIDWYILPTRAANFQW